MTPTKEQIEALAAALLATNYQSGLMETRREDATAILSALNGWTLIETAELRDRAFECRLVDAEAGAEVTRLETEIERLRAALKETYGLAFVANEGDDWYAKNAGIDAEAVLARAHAILAPKVDPPA